MTGSDTIVDAIVAGSGGGEVADSIQASRRDKAGRFSVFSSPTPAGTCSNCATVLSGPVCHSCGQTSDTFHRPIWDLLLDILDGLLGLEGRLWRTLSTLMFQPGKLTRHYLSGVRARYVMPFRLYLTASVLFFLAFSMVNGGESTEPDAVQTGLGEARTALESGEAAARLSGMPEGVRQELIEGVESAMAEIDSQAAETPEAREIRERAERAEAKREIRAALLPELYPEEAAQQGEDSEFVELGDGMVLSFDAVEGWPLAFRQRLADGADAIVDTDGEALWTAMKTWAPRLMFALLPIYALLLAVTHFYKRGLFFYDHLVVSLHFHAFLFFMFILLGAVSLAVGPGWALLIFFLWSNYYLYRLHRSVYEHGRFSSFMRTVLLDFVYMTILSLGFVALLLIGVLTSAG